MLRDEATRVAQPACKKPRVDAVTQDQTKPGHRARLGGVGVLGGHPRAGQATFESRRPRRPLTKQVEAAKLKAWNDSPTQPHSDGSMPGPVETGSRGDETAPRTLRAQLD